MFPGIHVLNFLKKDQKFMEEFLKAIISKIRFQMKNNTNPCLNSITHSTQS